MHVVEREHHRLALGQPLEQAPHRVVQPVALGALTAAGLAPVLAGQRREDRRELGHQALVQRPQERGLQRAQVVVERVDDQPERDVALELGGAALEHQVAPVLALAAKLREQPGFADARLADELQ